MFSADRLNKLNILIRSTDAQQLAFLGAGRFSSDGPKSQAQGLEPSQAFQTSSIGLLNSEERIYEDINKEPGTKNHRLIQNNCISQQRLGRMPITHRDLRQINCQDQLSCYLRIQTLRRV